MSEKGITYKQAGVDIEAAGEAVGVIKELVKSTHGPEVLSIIDGFAGLFALDLQKYSEPVLVSSADNVGTKLKVAFLMDKHDTVGIDLVGMCVNDILVCGAEPLFLLDYIALGKMLPDKVARVVAGIVAGCKQAGCALIGGETAELPGFYKEDEYDLAGSVVGVVERGKIIDGGKIQAGDAIIGIGSSGLHSNGYSLVRKVLLELGGFKVTDYMDELGKTLGEELLTPTKIYVKPVLKLLEEFEIKGIAHITGGGMINNILRILPDNTQVVINTKSWEVPAIFKLVQRVGRVDEVEMRLTFNMGVGLVLVLSSSEVEHVLERLFQLGEKAYLVGEVKSGEKTVLFV